MRYEWDEEKNKVNVLKHGINFEDAISIFDHPTLTRLDEREAYGEERWISIGLLQAIICVVVHVERNDDVIRIISARKATRRETKYYEQTFKN